MGKRVSVRTDEYCSWSYRFSGISPVHVTVLLVGWLIGIVLVSVLYPQPHANGAVYSSMICVFSSKMSVLHPVNVCCDKKGRLCGNTV